MLNCVIIRKYKMYFGIPVIEPEPPESGYPGQWAV